MPAQICSNSDHRSHPAFSGCESLDAIGTAVLQAPGFLNFERDLERHAYYPLVKLKERMATRPGVMLRLEAVRPVSEAGCRDPKQNLGYVPDCQQAGRPTTLATRNLGVTTFRLGDFPEKSAAMREVSVDMMVLAELSTIKGMLSTARPPKNAKRGRGRGGKQLKLTVDQRLKLLHADSPEVAEEQSLNELAKRFGCVASAFDRGNYYQTKLKPKREEVRAKKSMKRAKGLEPFQAEDGRASRDMREHVDALDAIDAHIDATWDTRRGVRGSPK